MKTGNDAPVDRLAAAVVLAAAIGLTCRGAAAFFSPSVTTLFDTGVERPVWYDASGQCDFLQTYLGWSSGQLCSPDCVKDIYPQRRTAQPFDLPPAPQGADAWQIVEIGVDGHVPWDFPYVNETLDFEIFTRSSLGTPPGPQDLVATGSVPFPTPIDNSEGFESLYVMHVDITLAPGDYWLTVWASTGDPATPSLFAWFTNAGNGISVLDGNGDAYMWRAATYPDPGFVFYRLDECTLQPYDGTDPDDLYNASFYIRGGPACPWDLDGSGSVGVVDFLDLVASWGDNADHPADFDGDGEVGVTDFLDLIAHWGPCP
jgi:hypothetical protein